MIKYGYDFTVRYIPHLCLYYFVLMCDTRLLISGTGFESEHHDDWFRESLLREGRRGATVIDIGHYPLYLERPGEEQGNFDFPPGKRHELLQLFLQNNVKAYLSGHTHRTVINQYGDMLLVSGETTSTVKQHFVSLLPYPEDQGRPVDSLADSTNYH